jgi:hydrogenase nickel incorporation protein HypB
MMCATCGCLEEGKQHDHGPDRAHGHGHEHAHEHPHEQAPGHILARSEPSVQVRVLAKNDGIAARTRRILAERGVLALNLVSSPGSGKTTLLERTIADLSRERVIQVIEGDQATSRDADRIRATGADAVQINTGTGCHLDAAMAERGLRELAPGPGTIVFIENVGNLVCPALFDLGERAKVVIVSVTEGEDKPLKYPHMFRASSLVLLSKMDLLPHVPFDPGRFVANARQVNPALEIVPLSAVTGTGLDRWYAWVRSIQ